MKNQFKDFPNMKIEVVANFYDIELDNTLVEKDSQTINLLYLSNIIKSKGIFELKYFFSSHVNTASGGECSSTAIRAMIKKLVAEEPAKKPLSDNKLAAVLADQGIQVARRTVAKYREAMNIPPSNERKRLI